MKEDFVSLEIAKLLKEKGFDWGCYKVYNTEGVVGISTTTEEVPINYKNIEYYFLCPTQQMTMKWLREVHKLHILIDAHESYAYESKIVFIWYVWNLNTHKKFTIINYSETFEQTCENAIMYCLTNLI